jgi:hypothetical protein
MSGQLIRPLRNRVLEQPEDAVPIARLWSFSEAPEFPPASLHLGNAVNHFSLRCFRSIIWLCSHCVTTRATAMHQIRTARYHRRNCMPRQQLLRKCVLRNERLPPPATRSQLVVANCAYLMASSYLGCPGQGAREQGRLSAAIRTVSK